MKTIILLSLFALVSCATTPKEKVEVAQPAPCEFPGVADGYPHPFDQRESEARCAEFKSDLRNYVMR